MYLLWFVTVGGLIALFVYSERLSGRIWQLEKKVEKLSAQLLVRRAQQAASEEAAPKETRNVVPKIRDKAVEVQTPAERKESELTRAAAEPEAGEGTTAPEGPWAEAAPHPVHNEADAAADTEAQERGDQTRSVDFETSLGTRWTVWVGGLALALGGIFLVRYTIEMGVFGPGVRIAMASAFGLVLVAAGELLRRTGFRVPIPALQSAYLPAILTAAGAFTLFGAVYAAHGIYGFIGPATAFLLLGAIGIAAILASLVHGVALAGLGLLGSYATPVLVASQAPNPWALFGFLAVILVASGAMARLRAWVALMGAAFAGAGIWWLLYLINTDKPDLTAVAFIVAVSLAVLVLWVQDAPSDRSGQRTQTIVAAIPAAFIALTTGNLALNPLLQAQGGQVYGAGMIIALVVVAALRAGAIPLLIAAAAAVFLIYANTFARTGIVIALWNERLLIENARSWAEQSLAPSIYWGLVVSAVFLACGVWRARSYVTYRPRLSATWLICAAAVPLIVFTWNWVAFGNLDKDLGHAFAALLLAALFVAVAEWLAWGEEPPLTGGLAVSIALVAASVFLAFGITIGFSSGFTTILIACCAVLPALATQIRQYRIYGLLSVGAVVLCMVRVFIDPTLVGSDVLGTNPVFNWLLPGYGIPALAFAASAWFISRAPDERPYYVLQAAAALFALLAAAMLVRHGMNDGVLEAGRPTLAEQSIYTLIAIGAGAILLALDTRSPSPVFRIGSMALGVISVVFVAFMHFLSLNPLLTFESTGRMTFFNLLLLGFLLPAVASAALAYYAHGKRPDWYVAMLAVLAAALGFAYATLSLRRLFQGEFISIALPTTQIETYAYSALWLAMGVALLVAGIRFGSRALRVASAVLVVVSVVKVFALDMSELEGMLRALSFIGLGIVLIGIGLFYQRMLTRARA